ncbi:MAG: hypothetical protein GY807_20965 [Gammaproteobacteria bacterium]|nr:hypothetical protein [Gammaproteobacteria bacterium]
MDTHSTERGFLVGEFEDANGEVCTIQESSAARSEGLIWLGCKEIGLRKLVPYQGWSDVELENNNPNGIAHTANNRMHLTQSQVQELLPTLQYFVEHGRLPKPDEST